MIKGIIAANMELNNRPAQDFLLASKELEVTLGAEVIRGLFCDRDVNACRGVASAITAIHRYVGRKPDGYSSPAVHADKPLDLDALPDTPQARLLGQVVNVSSGFTTEPPGRPMSDIVDYKGFCPEAEDKWERTYEATVGERNSSPYVQIFTRDGEPLVIRKSRGDLTALLLADLTVGQYNITYPAGSIMQISAKRDRSHVRRDRIRFPPWGVRVQDFEDITALQFSRLSVFALPKEAREDYFATHPPKLQAYASMESMRDAMHGLLQLHRPTWRTVRGVMQKLYP